jgi:G3E family GTPase
MSDRLSLTILGGFLGSGKTTWLRHQLHAGHYADAHLIVNEAAEEPVDDRLLTPAGGLTVLAGGCACCDAADRLAQTLRALCDARSAGRGPARVLLETSGLADPARISAMIHADPVLARHLSLSEIIVTVDAFDGPARIAVEPVARAQIGAADRVILTKTDRTGASPPDRLRASVHALAPGARVTAAVLGVEVSLGPADPAARPLDVAPGQDEPVQAHVLDVTGTDWPGLSVWLSALIHARGEDILRIKGVVDTPSGPLLLQSVGAHMQPPERLSQATNRLVLIGRGTSQSALAGSLARWCRDASASPRTGAGDAMGG